MTKELVGYWTSSLAPEVAHTVGIWVETLIFGLYTCLFFEAVYIMLKKRKENIASARVFLVATLLMYIVATAHVALGLHRLLRAYIKWIEPAAIYFMDFRQWETVAHNASLCVMTWLGDALVIYRCFMVWNRNFYIVMFPLALLFFQVAFNAMLLVWFTHPGMASMETVFGWMATIYPLIFVQNVITTGLLGFKIWKQCRESAENGVMDTSSKLSLGRILRIIIESAAIYTVQLLILLILYPIQHNAQYIVQSAVVPSIGIVFVLITVRMHITKSRTLNNDASILGNIPANWYEDDENSANIDTSPSGSSARVGVSHIEKSINKMELALPSLTDDAVLSRLQPDHGSQQ